MGAKGVRIQEAVLVDWAEECGVCGVKHLCNRKEVRLLNGLLARGLATLKGRFLHRASGATYLVRLWEAKQ